MKFSLPGIAIRHPIAVTMLAISIVGLGIIAWFRLPLKFLPEMDFPFIVCFVPYPGATPEQVEKEVAIPAEGEFSTIPHLTRISTTSTGDGCRIGMKFDGDTDMSTASAEVRDRIERLKLVLPEEVDKVLLTRFSAESLPIMAMGVFRKGDETEFIHLVRTVIQPRLMRLEGVAEVQVFAAKPEPEVLIEFDQNLLRTHNVSLYDVIAGLQFANINFSVGELLDGEEKLLLRVANSFSRPEDLGNLMVTPNGLRLNSIASVGFRAREEDVHYDIDDKGGAFVVIRKESEANTVATCKAIKDEMARIKTDPVFEGMETFQFFDQSDLILAALNGLIDAGQAGGLMACGILFMFLLRIRPTLIVALAIPTSMVAALTFMFFAKMTLNLVTMMSLIVAVGMLVDNAIVVLENIYRYCQLGLDPVESAKRGAAEVGIAITASTMTTMVVFIPVLYMETGEMAVYMREFAMPMTVSLLASLLGALTLIPLALSRIGYSKESGIVRVIRRLRRKGEAVQGTTWTKRWWHRVVTVHPLTWIIMAYGWCLDNAMRRRLVTVSAMVLVLVLTYLFPYQKVGMQEMPTLDMRQVNVDVKLDPNFDMAMSNDVFRQIKDAIDKQRDELDIKNLFTHYDPSGGQIEVYLREPEEYEAAGTVPRFSTQDVLNILWERLPPMMPGVEVNLSVPEGGTEGDKARTISVRMRGDDARLLASYAEQFKTLMKTIPDLSDVMVSTEREKQEVQLQIDSPRAKQAGISPMVIARTVDVALRGNRLPYMKQAGREFPVWAQFKEENRKSRDNLDNVTVLGETGSLVPLNQLVTFGKSGSPSTVFRVDGKNVVTVTAQVGSEDLIRVQKDLRRVIDSFEMPLGYTIDLGDEFREMETNLTNFATTLMMALILIYIVMAALFESLVLPMSVMTTVPLAFVGVYWIMYATSTSLDTIGLIGCILMVGVVVNNGIVIVDHINLLRTQGIGRLEAVCQAGRDRFRPVMMTALTTILGCVPLAITPEAGTTISFVSLGRALIGGLTTGTILTLVIVPLLYTIIDDAREWCMRYISSLRHLGTTSAGPGPIMTETRE